MGNCSGGGYYTDGHGFLQAFVVGETNGTWGTAQEVPGTAALNKGELAEVDSLSCAAPGDCSASGDYSSTPPDCGEAFVATEKNGTWGAAEEVPGTAALNKGGNAAAFAVSCGSVGNCSVGGWYEARDGHIQVFVISQQNGRWDTAEEVPGIAALNKRTPANLDTVSCGAPGNCGAGGSYKDGQWHLQAFVVNQT